MPFSGLVVVLTVRGSGDKQQRGKIGRICETVDSRSMTKAGRWW